MQLSEAQNLTITTQEHTNFRKLGRKCIESRAQNEQLSKPKDLQSHNRRPRPTETETESYSTPKNRNPQEFSSTRKDLTHMKSRKTKNSNTKKKKSKSDNSALKTHTKLQTATLLTPISEKPKRKKGGKITKKRKFLGANHRSFKREAPQHLATELKFQLGGIRATSRR